MISISFRDVKVLSPFGKLPFANGAFSNGDFEIPVSYVPNFRGWIKLIYDKISLLYSVKNAFNPTADVQNIENGVFQNHTGVFASLTISN